jgi:tetratricopeptide (TPR) repeat protein
MPRISVAIFGALCLAICAPPLVARAAAVDPPMTMPMANMSGPPNSMADWARGAMKFEGLAKAHRAISTPTPEAQAYFDQGMSLMWGFNHDEASRSFARAAEIDPHCAVCFWGLSLTVGPNYNLPFLTAERAKVAFEAVQRARAEAAHASPVEQALIEALARRYPGPAALDPDHLLPILTDYAGAMRDVARRFPDDLDVQTLYAESMMNLHAWKLWTPEGAPAPGTLEIVKTLKFVLARNPDHVGANHYFIHAIEASPHPERALKSAGRLRTAAPAEGHLDHMPAHIQQRVGRYEDAAEANRRGVKADLAYAQLTNAPDYYAVMYTAHNYQFLAFSAAMEGRRVETLDAVDRSRAVVPDAMLRQMPGLDWYVAEVYGARVRFGLWDQLLAMSAPDSSLPGLMAGYLYGRGMAQAARGQIEAARTSLAALKALLAGLPEGVVGGQNLLKDILAVAIPTVEARIARAEGRTADELSRLRAAVAGEDHLAYDEPWNWFVPTRQVLGEALLRSGAQKQAEAVYREDLKSNRVNGWALKGLAKALAAEGRRSEAAKVGRSFRKAWRRADTPIQASAF